MQRLVDLFIRRPVFASMVVATLVVIGTASFLRLRVDRFPSVDLPTVSVRTTEAEPLVGAESRGQNFVIGNHDLGWRVDDRATPRCQGPRHRRWPYCATTPSGAVSRLKAAANSARV